MTARISRRAFLLWLVASLVGIAAAGGSARAKNSGSGGSGSGGGGDSDGGGDSSGKGGGDDSGGDDGGGDDGGDDGDGNEGDGKHRNRRDYERAKEAVRNGRSRPLPEILRTISSQYPGRVIDVRLNRRSNSLMYDVKVITPAGKLIRVRVDAASGAIVGAKGI